MNPFFKKIAKRTGRSALQVTNASLANNSFNKIELITKRSQNETSVKFDTVFYCLFFL